MTEKKRTFEFGDAVAAYWFRAVAVFIVFAAIATLTDGKLAAESDFPLLQDGSARTDFLSGVYKKCLERQRKLPENTSLTTPELGQYCLCYGRALADTINASEFQAVTLGGATPASFLQKTASSAKLCRAKMRPEGTARERNIATVTNECSRTYFPEDTDFAASVVRNKYCVCFASGLVDLATNDKLIANELNGGQTPSAASTKAVKQIKDYCSRQL